jgi:hypothetical protein
MVLDHNPSDILGQQNLCEYQKPGFFASSKLSEPEFKRQSLKETSPVSKIGNTKSRFFVVVLLEAV